MINFSIPFLFSFNVGRKFSIKHFLIIIRFRKEIYLVANDKEEQKKLTGKNDENDKKDKKLISRGRIERPTLGYIALQLQSDAINQLDHPELLL